MPTRNYDRLPFLDKEPATFERLAYSWVRAAIDANAEHMGAAGKGDKGCDIRAKVGNKVLCYQVKRRKELPFSEVKVELQKLLDHWQPDEIVFICACDIQTEVRLKAEAFASPTPCTFLGRSEFESRLWEHPRLIEQFFGSLRKPGKAPLWNIPQGVRFFTGREAMLQELREALTEQGQAALGQSLAVSGLGGIGKTQTAIAYANEYRLQYTFCFWIAAESETTLRASFSEIASLLNLTEFQGLDEDRVLTLVLQELTGRAGGLLIYDNVEDPELVRRFTPNPQVHHMLVTSRLQTLRRFGFPLLELPVLELEDAVHFLHKRTGRKEVFGSTEYQAASKLAEELGYLPLALEQAAAYVDLGAIAFTGYLTAYKARGLTLLEEYGAIDHPDSVAVTWAMNFEQVQQEDPLSIELLQTLTNLAPEDVPEELLQNIPREQLGQEVGEETEALALARILGPLRRYSLVDRDVARGSLSTHRLVLAMTRLSMDEEEKKNYSNLALQALAKTFPDPELDENHHLCDRLVPHVLLLFASRKPNADQASAAISLYEKTGARLLRRARFAEARPLLECSLALIEETGHDGAHKTLNSLATYHFLQGNYHLAEPLFLRALGEVNSQEPSRKTRQNTAKILNNLGTLNLTQGYFEKADTLLHKSLQISKQAFGSQHANTLMCTNNLSTLYRYQRKFDESESIVLQAIESLRQHEERISLVYVQSLNTLALCYIAQDQNELAEPYLIEAMGISEDIFEESHPEFAKCLNNLASVYLNQRQFRHAEPHFLRSLKIKTSILGENHVQVANTLSNLAEVYNGLGSAGEAEHHYRKALSIYSEVLRADHPNYVQVSSRFEEFLKALGRDEEAKDWGMNHAEAIARIPKA